MSVNHRPARPLPFKADGPIVKSGPIWIASLPWDQPDFGDERKPAAQHDAAYIAHAANAYPKLIEALRGVMGLVQLLGHAHDDQATKNHRQQDAERLLRELGEDE